MNTLYLQELVRNALLEDIGSGDLTTSLIISPSRRSTAHIVARQALALAGTDAAELAFGLLDPEIRVELKKTDGAALEPNEVIAVVTGKTAAILSGERTALNFLQRMSGIATLTRRYVEQVAGLNVRIADTRKTTPGWRLLEKKAVRLGGGVNHRAGLYDGILIKENHLAALGAADAIKHALEEAHRRAHHLAKVEIEVGSPGDAERAALAGADAILLDNMNITHMGEAVRRVRAVSDKIVIEASGSVSLDNVRRIAETGVDIISIGKLTHSAPAVDISLEIEKSWDVG